MGEIGGSGRGMGCLSPVRQGRKKADPPSFFAFCAVSGLSAELAKPPRPRKGREGWLSRQRQERRGDGVVCVCVRV